MRTNPLLRVLFLSIWGGMCILPGPGCKRNSPALTVNDRVDSLQRQAIDSVYSRPEYTRLLLDSALRLSSDSDRYYQVVSTIGRTYFQRNLLDSGFLYINKVRNYLLRHPDASRQNDLRTHTWNLIGVYYQQTGRIDSCISYYKKAYRSALCGKENAEQRINISINLADSYLKNGDYANSVDYYRQACQLTDSAGSQAAFYFPIHTGLGTVYKELYDFDHALHYFSLAEPYYESSSLGEKFFYCISLGNCYYEKGDYPAALPWFRKARNLLQGIDAPFYMFLSEANLGEIFLLLHETDSAVYYIDRSYDFYRKLNHPSYLYHITTVKANLAIEKKKYQEAAALFGSASDTTGIEPNYLVYRKRSLLKYFVSTGRYDKAYRYQAAIKAYDDSLRNDRTQKRVAEIDLRYRQDTTLLKQNLIISEKTTEVQRLQHRMYFVLLVLLFLICIGIIIYMYLRRQRDLQFKRHIAQVAKLRMESIRNRVSPHFIFNVLNREIAQDDAERKHDTHLRELVFMLRRSLEVTEKLTVSLPEEIAFVKNYIALQQDLFKDTLSVCWHTEGPSDLSKFEIPAMIIQIPVENAIKHGLALLKDEKKLTISITGAAGGVSITITDNGTGYKPSGTPSDRGTGTGLKVLFQTIEILNSQNERKIAFRIENNSVRNEPGTTVRIFIPQSFNYSL